MANGYSFPFVLEPRIVDILGEFFKQLNEFDYKEYVHFDTVVRGTLDKPLSSGFYAECYVRTVSPVHIAEAVDTLCIRFVRNKQLSGKREEVLSGLCSLEFNCNIQSFFHVVYGTDFIFAKPNSQYRYAAVCTDNKRELELFRNSLIRCYNAMRNRFAEVMKKAMRNEKP